MGEQSRISAWPDGKVLSINVIWFQSSLQGAGVQSQYSD